MPLLKEDDVMANKSVMKDFKLEDALNELNKDPEFRKENRNQSIKDELIIQMIKCRKEQNITQQQLADLVGTKKSNISRLEHGNGNPSLDTIINIVNALGKNISFTIK